MQPAFWGAWAIELGPSGADGYETGSSGVVHTAHSRGTKATRVSAPQPLPNQEDNQNDSGSCEEFLLLK